MQQRQLRLGDILDDYCPRERRITNHAIVAMIAEDVRQTRCTTCDAEHEYKQARVPPQRRRKASEVAAPAASAGASRVIRAVAPALEATAADRGLPPKGSSSGEAPEAEEADGADAQAEPADDLAADGPVHRQLIRATLPRPEGQTPVRPMPDFTMRHAPGPGRFRPSGGRGQERHRAPHGGGAPRQAAGRSSNQRPFSSRPTRQASAMRPGKKRSK
jgi:hypothetical protein